MMVEDRVAGSFRDPCGFVFLRGEHLYRQVNKRYRENYDRLMDSGLYSELVDDGLLVRHSETDDPPADANLVYKIIQPEMVPFVSYPYEWCFSQLKDAALLTLAVQKRALAHDMVLKDASAYNVQFLGARPILIDTLSFEEYREGEPWVAYRQFCQHLLAPLALMAHKDIRLGQLLRVHIDGVPLDLASGLLPTRTRFTPGLLTHVHLHAGSQRRYAARRPVWPGRRGMPRISMLGLIDSLEATIRRLRWKPLDTEWGDYYDKTNYSEEAMQDKERILSGYLDELKPRRVWDVGANTGRFSRIAASKGAFVVAFDVDAAAVENNYRQCRREAESNLLPLFLDLANPSPAIGWNNEERPSVLQRGPTDTLIALALVHHLAVSNNVPFESIAESFARCCCTLIIEFVPKEDSQVQRMLVTREDIFVDYNQHRFEKAFAKHFDIIAGATIRGSGRRLYMMSKRSN